MSTARDIAIRIAEEAGTIMRSYFRLSVERTWKDDDSPLTRADVEIHELTVGRLSQAFPDVPVLSEEGDYGDAAQSGDVWVCDPLDGTMPFVTGYPTSVFALSLCRNGEPVLGVLHDPFLDRMVVGERGKGTLLNGQTTRVSGDTTLARTAVDVSNLPQARYFTPGLHDTIGATGARPTSLYSSAYAGLLLAAGQFAGVILSQDTPWDGAAVKVIVEEAGGKVTSLSGGEQRYDVPIEGYVASNGHLHAALLEIVNRCRQSATSG